MPHSTYLMENSAESIRMEIKTKKEVIEKHARWAGILPGMRVADIGCGPGKTTSFLHKMVQPGGEVVGIDFSKDRIAHAKNNYMEKDIAFHCMNINEDLTRLGKFDLVWIRFVLEYHREKSFEIVSRLADMLHPEGILCLIDLDQNCLNHYDTPPKLAAAMQGLIKHLSTHHDFDPQAGRKLYSYLYDLNFKNIDVHIEPHHLIFGEIDDSVYFNWKKKVIVAGKGSGYDFKEYGGNFDDFYREFETFFRDSRRFTYTPVICCRGRKPA
jgi:ubiquinone/menaquinone biosynthesis C-methylase UbiE